MELGNGGLPELGVLCDHDCTAGHGCAFLRHRRHVWRQQAERFVANRPQWEPAESSRSSVRISVPTFLIPFGAIPLNFRCGRIDVHLLGWQYRARRLL